MRVSIALVAIAVGLPASALAQPRWTFCVAASKSGADVLDHQRVRRKP